MSDFSDDWLALRAAADGRARADGLLTALLQDWPAPREVVDLGAGTGANLRHLVKHLGHGQRWTCVDHDPALLARLPVRTKARAQSAGDVCDDGPQGFRYSGDGWSCTVTTRRLDLAADLDRLELPNGGLVTASALLDLVSEAWLERLLHRALEARCRLLFALSYDGRCRLDPALPGDAGVIGLVNAHQCGDKGFGPALGPAAADRTSALCRGLGYRVESENSDWLIGPHETALQRALLDGWLAAALEMTPQASASLTAWRQAREARISEGISRIEVGHRDIAATPDP